MTNEEQTNPAEGAAEVVTEEKAEVATEVTEAPNEQAQVEPPEVEKPQKPTRSQRRREAKERLEAEIKQAKQERDRALAAAKGITAPSEKDFENPDDYVAARASFNAVSQMREADAQGASQRIEDLSNERQAEVKQAWAEQAAEARERYPDFTEVALKAPISEEVAMMLPEMENGADVAYYLGKNPETALAISNMNPTQAAIELGKVSAKAAPPAPRVLSQATPPIETVTATASSTKDPSEMSQAEYRAHRGM